MCKTFGAMVSGSVSVVRNSVDRKQQQPNQRIIAHIGCEFHSIHRHIAVNGYLFVNSPGLGLGLELVDLS